MQILPSNGYNPHYAIKCLMYHVSRDKVVGEWVAQCPQDVDIWNVRSYLEHHLGPVLDVAYTKSAEHGEIQVGWTFRAPKRDGFEVIAMPMIRDQATGDLTGAWIWEAEQRAMMQQLSTQFNITPTTITEPERAWTPPNNSSE